MTLTIVIKLDPNTTALGEKYYDLLERYLEDSGLTKQQVAAYEARLEKHRDKLHNILEGTKNG